MGQNQGKKIKVKQNSRAPLQLWLSVIKLILKADFTWL